MRKVEVKKKKKLELCPVWCWYVLKTREHLPLNSSRQPFWKSIAEKATFLSWCLRMLIPATLQVIKFPAAGENDIVGCQMSDVRAALWNVCVRKQETKSNNQSSRWAEELQEWMSSRFLVCRNPEISVSSSCRRLIAPVPRSEGRRATSQNKRTLSLNLRNPTRTLFFPPCCLVSFHPSFLSLFSAP